MSGVSRTPNGLFDVRDIVAGAAFGVLLLVVGVLVVASPFLLLVPMIPALVLAWVVMPRLARRRSRSTLDDWIPFAIGATAGSLGGVLAFAWAGQ